MGEPYTHAWQHFRLGHCVVCVVAIQGIKVKGLFSGFKLQNAAR